MHHGVLFYSPGNADLGRMAEAFARAFLPPGVPVFRDGPPAPPPDPAAALILAEAGLELPPDRPPPDEAARAASALAVTVGAGPPGSVPEIPGVKSEFWPVLDPARVEGVGRKREALRAARDDLLARVWKMADSFRPEPAVGIIGGTGFYDLPGLSDVRRIEVETPFGAPSDALVTGRLAGRRVVFLARHGPRHSFLPSEVNARANVCAMKRCGVTRLLSVSAVGSLREGIAPGRPVLPRQFIDRTAGRPGTFFGEGVVAHASMADPVCNALADALADAAEAEGGIVHRRGTYLCIEGPQFSTRAESALWRAWGADVVGMTGLPEARLAREAELCYATLALPTDYDCWREHTEAVNVDEVMASLRANTGRARSILARAVASLDPGAPCACRTALDAALLTPPEAIDAKARVRLHAVLARRLSEKGGG